MASAEQERSSVWTCWLIRCIKSRKLMSTTPFLTWEGSEWTWFNALWVVGARDAQLAFHTSPYWRISHIYVRNYVCVRIKGRRDQRHFAYNSMINVVSLSLFNNSSLLWRLHEMAIPFEKRFPRYTKLKASFSAGDNKRIALSSYPWSLSASSSKISYFKSLRVGSHNTGFIASLRSLFQKVSAAKTLLFLYFGAHLMKMIWIKRKLDKLLIDNLF